VIDTVKKFFDIAFKDETWPYSVLRDRPSHAFQNSYSFMRAKSDPARERVRDKRFFKNRIYDRENSVMQHAVSHAGFVDMPLFRIANPKPFIWPVPISFITKVVIEAKNILFKISLEYHYIWLVALIAFEHSPGEKEIFRRCY